MENKNVEYYLTKDQPEDDKLTKQIEEAVSSSNEENSDEEIRAAIGLMLLHYQSVARIEKQRQDSFNRQLIIANEQPPQTEPVGAVRPNKRPRPSGYCSNTFLLASCRDIIREFLYQNDY